MKEVPSQMPAVKRRVGGGKGLLTVGPAPGTLGSHSDR